MCLLCAVNERTICLLVFHTYFHLFWLLIMLFYEFKKGEFALHMVIVKFLVMSYCFDFQFLNLVLKGE